MQNHPKRMTIKLARILSVWMATGTMLPLSIQRGELKKYITDNLYTTSRWMVYYKSFATLRPQRNK